MRFLLFECARELLVNVRKHAGVERAALTFARLPAGELRLRVTDEGKGFDPNGLRELERAAMSFGLFSIRERLAHLGGWMELETAPGLGTAVALFVPAGEVHPAASDSHARAGRTGAGAYALRQRAPRCRVVIVDDHRIVREGIAGLLRMEADIEVVGEAETGAQAIALAAELKPDVIIMDINLGTGIDGIEATRRVLAMSSKITVIGLSMHVDRDIADAMLAAGAAAYLTKGGPPEDLIGAIRAHAGR
jgi:CheY-like chemotaxis protein